jgi:membrane-bound metal-dependent hydrolase YbcI (DUF457 family)
MMGRTHALSGAVAWLGAVPLLSREQWLGSYAVSLSPGQMIAGAVVCAGAAVLPDVDHHNGRIAHTFGPVTRVMCRLVGKAAGGHRHATHSILFALGAGYAMDLLATHFVYGWWAALFLIVGLGLRGVGLDFEKHEHWSTVADGAAAAFAVFLMHGLDMSFAGYAVTLGCLAHLAGDCLTPRGCPIFWPVRRRVEIPLVSRTDGVVEQWIVAPLLAVVAVVLAARAALGGGAAHWLGTG